MTWPLALAILVGAAAAWLVWCCVTAPEGYEDETGFHYGRED